MKNIFLALLTLFSISCFSQTTGYLRYDTVKIMKQNGNSNLIIENATRDSLGFLYNYGSGRTRFEVIRAVPGGIKVGNDTINVSGTTYTAGSGIAISGDSIHLGGPTTTPAVLYDNRVITAGTNTLTLSGTGSGSTTPFQVLGKAKFGTNQTSALSHLYVAAYDTVTSTSGFVDRGIHVDRRTVLPNSYTGNPLSTFLMQAYLKPDSLITFPSSSVDETGLGFSFATGFLDKTGSVTSIINGGTTARLSTALGLHKFATSGISRAINSFFSNTKYVIELVSAGTVTSYADIVAGVTKTLVPTVTNRYGLYIDQIDHANVTNPYAIYQAGTTDTSVFAGKMRFTGLPTSVGTKAVRIDANGYLSAADTTTISSTPGIDDVLSVAQALSTGRTITQGAFTITHTGTGALHNYVNANTTAVPWQRLDIKTRDGITGAANSGLYEETVIDNASSSGVIASEVGTRWDDATAGSEDAKYDINLATAGAAPTNKLSIKSSGVLLTNAGADTLETRSGARSRAETVTNKRNVRRVTTITSSATPTPAGDDTDIFTVTALAAGAVFAAPTGTPIAGQGLIMRIKDNGGAQTLGWNAIYRAGDITLPTTTVAGKYLWLGFIWNDQSTTWDLLSKVDNF